MAKFKKENKDQCYHFIFTEYRETFSLFDVNDDNTVPVSEVGNVLRAVGQSPTEADLQDMMKEMENNGILHVSIYLNNS